MSRLPLAARVVEVIADLGEDCHPRYRLGSGCLVAGRTVLTAAHVVADAVSVMVRGPDKVEHAAALDPALIGDANGPGPDLALIEITDDIAEVPPISVAAVNRDSSSGEAVDRCHVIGYPIFKERVAPNGGRFRETADAVGKIPVLSGLAGGLLSVDVSSTPRALPPEDKVLEDSPWSGLSGAPVVTDGHLLAVATEHAPREGPSAITATPLTALEYDPAHPGWGPGVANPGVWWSRLGISSVKALKQLPAPRKDGESIYWATVREIRQRTGLLTGRQDELTEISSFATGDEGYRWLVGEAWAGKTALLAEAVLTLPEDVNVVCYFMSRREADADSSRFLAAVVPQLAWLLDEEPRTDGLHEFRALWQRAVEQASSEGRHLLLVVDGLDEDLHPEGLLSVAAMLPAGAGAHAHVLVSSRPKYELARNAQVGHPLSQLRPVAVIPYVGAQELKALARQEIDNLLHRGDYELAANVLGLLAAAAGPLAVRDLAALTSIHLTKIRRFLSTSAARSLQVTRRAGEERYQFAHESLLAHAQDDDDLNDPDFRRRIDHWADEWHEIGWPPRFDRDEATPNYLLDTYPYTLTGGSQRLAQLVEDIGWIEAAILSAGVDSVLAVLQRAAAANPASPAVAAIRVAVTGQAHNLRPPHPIDQPGYILRQLCLQSAELAEESLGNGLRSRLQARTRQAVAPLWTTRRASRALSVELGSHRGQVRAVAVLPDGRVVTGGDDRRLRVWDPTAIATPIELGGHRGMIRAAAALPDGRVVTGGDDQRVLLWNLDQVGDAPIELGRHGREIRALAVLPDGRVASSGDDWRVLMWDPNAPKARHVRLGGHDGIVRAVAVLPDGRVVTGGDDEQVLLWRTDKLDIVPVKLGSHLDSVRVVAALADGRVVSGGDDGLVRIWNPAYESIKYWWPWGTVAGRFVGRARHHGRVRALAVLRDGRVVSGGDDWIRIWKLAEGADPMALGRHDGMVRALGVLPDGRVVSGGDDGRVRIWDPLMATSHRGVSDSGDMMLAVAVLPGSRVVSGGHDGRVLVWDLNAPGADPIQIGRRSRGVGAVAVLPDGRVVSGGHDGHVLVWDLNVPGADPIQIGCHSRGVGAVAVLLDGRVVSGGDDRRVLLWNPTVASAARLALPTELGRHRRAVTAMAVLPGDRVVSGGDDGRVLIWAPDAPRAAPIELGRHSGGVGAIAVLPDGRVVSGGDDGRLLVWASTKVAPPMELGRHSGAVQNIAVLPDGRIFSGGRDKSVRLWDVSVQAERARISCSALALAVALSPDGDHLQLVMAHAGEGISTWSIPSD